MATTDVGVETQLDLFDRLQTGAADACSRLASYCRAGHRHSVELNRKFYDAVADIERVTIERLAATAGAFSISDGHLRIAEGPVANLLNVVTRDVEKRMNEDRGIAAEEIPLLLEKVFVEYVFHEVRHRTQGLAMYGDVKALKGIAGNMAMSDYDVLADRDAALASAAIYAENGTRAAFLSAFRDALFFSTRFFFEVFPIPADRPDKIARAISILFMVARLAKRDFSEPFVEDDRLPLDTPLSVNLSEDRKQLAVHQSEPSRALIGTAGEHDGVPALVEQICRGKIDQALQTTFVIADKLKLTG